MSGPDRFDTLGRALAEAQDRQRAVGQAARRDVVRSRLIDAASGPTRARGWRLALPMGAALALAVVLLSWWGLSATAMTFDVGPERAPGVVGAWLAAPVERDESLRFSDGSEIDLHPGSRARVADLRASGARVVLETGAADVRIESGPSRAWQVDAGPYRVRVTGTRFSVAWDPAREAFDLDLREGSVIVEGPLLSGEHRVVAGEVLHRSARPALADATTTRRDDVDDAPPAQADPVDAPPVEVPTADAVLDPAGDAEHDIATAPDHAAEPSKRGRRAPRASPTVEEQPDGWRELAARSSYREALAAAEAAGFSDLCDDLPSRDLLRLADVARFARRPARAIEALDALRRRFPDTDAAAMAAFEHGRIASTGKHAYAEAAKWFATYLQERPDGPIAREALGRLMEAQSEAGQTAAARKSAARYLARYPEGPHADLATELE